MAVTRRRLVTASALAAFVAGSAIAVDRDGLFLRKDAVLLWMLALLFALSLSDLKRWGRGLIVDWLPLAVLLVFYDTSRDLATKLHIQTHTTFQIAADKALFGSPIPTVRLQQALHESPAVRIWEYPMFVVYLSHFFAAIVVAGILWKVAYPRFRAFRAQLIALTTLGFATYVLFPARPPWMAAQDGALPPIHRAVFDVWDQIGMGVARTSIEQGSAFDNDVAAVPSMHAAITLLILLFFWKRANKPARAALVAYVLAMAWTLVYGGEHYVFDVLLGWLYAAAVAGGAAVLARVRERRASGVPSTLNRTVPTITPTPLQRGPHPDGA